MRIEDIEEGERLHLAARRRRPAECGVPDDHRLQRADSVEVQRVRRCRSASSPWPSANTIGSPRKGSAG